MDAFNILAGLASILGLGFTIYAVVEVVRLKRMLYLLLHLRTSLERMEVASRRLLDELKVGAISREMQAELKRQEATIAQIRQNLPRRDRVGVEKERLKLADALQEERLSVDRGWEAYEQLTIVIDRLRTLLHGYELRS